MNKAIKIVSVNLIVFVVLFAVSAVVYSYFSSEKVSKKALLPNYDGVAWAQTYYKEIGQLNTRYSDYTIWRREAFSGETININRNGLRWTVNGESGDRTVFFFGGSTMWGASSDDANTIPSIFASSTPYRAYNYGEAAWTAHQSLYQLMKLYIEGRRPDIVVFYDGYNEVRHKCRTELNFYSAARERQMRQTMKYSTSTEKLKYYGRPFVDLADAIKGFSSDLAPRNCDVKPDKARLIAATLIQDWQIAKSIVEGHCGTFIAILQPNAYVGTPRLDHLPYVENNERFRAQISAVYPLIKQRMTAEEIGHDFTGAFDSEQYLYVDTVHVSPQGNARIATRLADLLSTMEQTSISADQGCPDASTENRN